MQVRATFAMYGPARSPAAARRAAARRASHAPELAPAHFPLPASSAHAQPAQKSPKSVGKALVARPSSTSSGHPRRVAFAAASRSQPFSTQLSSVDAISRPEDAAATRLARDRARALDATSTREGGGIDREARRDARRHRVPMDDTSHEAEKARELRKKLGHLNP